MRFFWRPSPQFKRAQALRALEDACKRYPQLRIGQLISNAAYIAGNDQFDPFYLEDDELAKILREYKP